MLLAVLPFVACDNGPKAQPQITDPSQLQAFSRFVELEAGDTTRLANRSFQPTDARWRTSNSAVATVDQSGLVIGVGPGTATITATGSFGGRSTDVKVNPAALVKLELRPDTLRLDEGASLQLSATPRDRRGRALNDRNIVWRTLTPELATVDGQGLVTARAVGLAIIEASAEGVPARAALSIQRAEVAAIGLGFSSISLIVGQSQPIVPVLTDSGGRTLSNRPLRWSSSNSTVASVSQEGLVVAVGPGTGEIAVESEGKSSSLAITVAPPPVASISVNPAAASLLVGGRLTLQVSAIDVRGQPAGNRPTTWRSSAPAVATVSEAGEVLAVAVGSAEISALVEGRSAVASIVVRPAQAASIAVVPQSLNLQIGQSASLTATVLDEAGRPVTGKAITWKSADPTVATVSSSGSVRALKAGTVMISASVDQTTATVRVSVARPPVASVNLVPSTASIEAGAGVGLAARLVDALGGTATDRVITWSSSNTAVATVSGVGAVTAIAPGSATITAEVEGVRAQANIVVTPVPVATIVLSPTSLTLAVSQQQTAVATLLDAAGRPLSGRVVTWSSSASAVATVSAGGVVTGVGVGSATVRASSEGKSATLAVLVSAPTAAPVASVTVSPASKSLRVGETTSLAATPYDATGTPLAGRTVTWSSSATGVATVSAAGVVTAVGAGSATITATSEGRAGTAAITVTMPPVASITLVPSAPSLTVGQAVSLVATLKDAAGNPLTGRPITWSSSSPGVASVSTGGLVSAIAAGQTTITAAAEGITAVAVVTVVPVPVATVAVSPGSLTLVVGGTSPLSAVARDAGGAVLTGRSVVWSSGSPAVATVSTGGIVTAVGPGTANIVATVEGKTGSATVSVSVAPVATVAVSPPSAGLVVGQTQALSATLKDASGATLSGRSVTWTSSAVAVATVSAAGLVTAVGPGSATITALAEGKSGVASITVSAVPVASVTVAPASTSLPVGQTAPMTATLRDAGGSVLNGRSVTWSSSAPSIASVSSTGVVTAVASGSATITATAEGKSGTASVVVTLAPVAVVTINPATSSLLVGGTANLAATTKDAGGSILTGRAVTWSSSAPGVATVSTSGVVTGIAAGSATITATSEGISGTAAITVSLVPVATVAVSPATAALVVGGSAPLTATPKDAGGAVLTGRSVTWSSSAPGVATVSTSGVVSGVAVGSATITATSEGKTGTAAITVSLVPVATVAIVPATIAMVVGELDTLIATAKDAGGNALTGRAVTWSSSAPGVATVSATGVLTGVAAGSATITATAEGKSGTAAITVSLVPVATVAIAPATVAMVVGELDTLTATARDAGGNALTGRPVTWSSSAPGVATVSASGVVTGVAAGSATITATSEGKVGTAAVTVALVPVATVAVTPATAALVVGGTTSLTATTKDGSGNPLAGRTVTWSSGTPTVATVSASGVVTGVAAGSATITATSEGKSGTAVVTVNPVPVATVVVTPATASVSAGGSTTLTATTKDAGGATLSGRAVTWSSSAPAIATVSTSGTVTGVAAGSATITATSEGKNGTAAITVSSPPPPPPPPPPPGPVAFPLKTASGKHYLVDATGAPFLIHGDAAWSLMVQLTREKAVQYLDDRRARGFNTLLVNLIENLFAAAPPKNAYGQGPFLVPGDFSTPNEAYFAHVDYVLGVARSKGFLVLLAPVYLGAGGGIEGWYTKAVANGPAKLRTFGRYVATRFRAFDNILWVHGGDYTPPDLSLPRAVADGIRDVEPTKWLHTYHGGRGETAFGSAGSEPWLQVNNTYTGGGVLLSVAAERARPMPFFLSEALYENATQPASLTRRQAYQANLGGAGGQVFGNSIVWEFASGWETAMAGPGSRGMTHLKNLMVAREWWQLEPDYSHTFMTLGYGELWQADFAMAARSSTGAFGIAYTPQVRDLSFRLTAMTGPRVSVRWYDPTSGAYQVAAGSPFAATGTITVRPPGLNAAGEGDWAVLLESVP